MDPQSAIDLAREALWTTVIVASPVLVAALIVGLVIGLFQAMTQIQEQSVVFVPKIIVMLLVLSISLPWLISRMVQYTSDADRRHSRDGFSRSMNDENWLVLFALVFARVAGLTMTAPIYGTNDVPLQVRVLLAAALALLIAPMQWHGARSLWRPGPFLTMLGVEAAIGACLGLGVLVLIHGMTLAGELVAQASGLGHRRGVRSDDRGERLRCSRG